MITNEKTSRNEALIAVARKMMTAARTAPKACGIDNLEIEMVAGDDIARLAAKMRELSVAPKRSFFVRDAGNIEAAGAVVLIGTRNSVLRLDCGYCGFATCGEKPASAPCVFNTHDLGLAVGSAVSVAADERVDSRVMFSVGVAARELGLVGGCEVIMAIPIASGGKSPFFDRAVASCAK